MKHLKSSLKDLHSLFHHNVTARYLSEPFVSFDGPRSSGEIFNFMQDRDFDVVGVRENGRVVGYVFRDDLVTGALNDHIRPYDDHELFDEGTPFINILTRLSEMPRVYIQIMGCVSGIITKGDLQKAPLRMWLFSLLSLLEMQFLRLIRTTYPSDSWLDLLTKERIQQSQRLLEDRRLRNEAIDLADCLQFGDKGCIVAKSDSLRRTLGFDSRSQAEERLHQIETLRNNLVHAQDIITCRWPELVRIAETAEKLLERCEGSG